ncbi:type IV pilus biogenesis protein PilM [Bacillus sp. V5-8f]|uniref:type IV pilus biogenesis protein PilM n=1 Tax=Bacillus sp. V5-8f TaxID=2053044 RepID=UPI000C77F9F9|nr:pilus assembly protein PilM [Bacillus sp. V5-8f]PLT32393.1 hypothetical protein CUU64_20070 [Bacillus sp. V5-8f]
MFKSSKRQLHIVMKDRYIHFLESGKDRSFLAYGQRCLPKGVVEDGQIKEHETLTMILEEIVDQHKLKGCKISFCVPDSFVIIRKVEVPLELLDEEITGYLYMELGESIHLPFEDPIIEGVPLRENGERKEVLLIASKESIVKEFSSLFKEVSLKPVVADLSLLSLYRTYYHLNVAQEDEHLLMIQIGLNSMLLSVFHKYKPIILHQFSLSFTDQEYETEKNRSGSEYFTWKGEFDRLMGEASDITTEIERFINYYNFNITKGKHQVTKILLSGDHPCMELFHERIDAAFQIDIQPLLKPLFQTKKGINIPAVYAECIGLALK